MVKTSEVSKKEYYFNAVKDIVPAKYHSMVSNLHENLPAKRVKTYRSLVLNGYKVEEIVPFCMDELISMGANDLWISNLSCAHTDTVSVMNIYSVTGYQRHNHSGISLDTAYVGDVYARSNSDDFNKFFPSYKKHKGWSIVKHSDSEYQHVQRFNDIRLPQYTEDFIFRVKGKDLKKIEVDIPSLQYFQEVLNEKEFATFKSNFKKVQSNGTVYGE